MDVLVDRLKLRKQAGQVGDEPIGRSVEVAFMSSVPRICGDDIKITLDRTEEHYTGTALDLERWRFSKGRSQRSTSEPSSALATRQHFYWRCAMTTYKVGYLIGSLAKESINRKLAKALIRLAPESLRILRDLFPRPAAVQLRL